MKAIDLQKHMYLDYLVVGTFSVAPLVLKLEGIAVAISLALALVHALVTIFTFIPKVSFISPTVHGWIEFTVAPLLAALPWILGFSHHTSSVLFFASLAALIFVVWALTDYESEQ